MLSPHPESDLRLNILVLGSEIISDLKNKKNFILVEEVLKDFLKKSELRNADLFFDVLTFLYTIDIIEHSGYKIRLKKHDSTQKTLF
jgi:hypothetical protein